MSQSTSIVEETWLLSFEFLCHVSLHVFSGGRGPDISGAHRRKGWVKEQLQSFLECVKFEIAWSPAACFSSVSSCSARLMIPSSRAAALGVEVAAKWSCSCQCQMTLADVVVGRAFWSKTGLKFRVFWKGVGGKARLPPRRASEIASCQQPNVLLLNRAAGPGLVWARRRRSCLGLMKESSGIFISEHKHAGAIRSLTAGRLTQAWYMLICFCQSLEKQVSSRLTGRVFNDSMRRNGVPLWGTTRYVVSFNALFHLRRGRHEIDVGDKTIQKISEMSHIGDDVQEQFDSQLLYL